MNPYTLEFVYREISATKAVAGAEFERSVQYFNFGMGAPNCWVSSKSYFLISATLAGRAGAIPLVKDQVAFADDMCAGLYNNAYFKVGGQDVSSIVSYLPQAHALRTRTTKSRAFLNSVGQSAYMSNADFQERVALTASDTLLDVASQQEYFPISSPDGTGTLSLVANTGVITAAGGALFSRIAAAPAPAFQLEVGDMVVMGGVSYKIITYTNATTITVGVLSGAGASPITCGAGNFHGLKMRRRDGGSRNNIMVAYQPPLGIFDHDQPMGAGDYRFSLNPNSNYKTACVESAWRELRAGVGVADDYDFVITNVRLYVATMKMTIPQDLPPIILYESFVQSKPASATGSYEFTVPSSTTALCVFIQSGSAGSSTLIPATRFVNFNGSQNNITGLQISYANAVKPSTKWPSSFTNTTNNLQQRYLDNLIESEVIESPGGAESFGEWLQRGAYYYYSFNRDREDKSTQVQMTMDFTAIEANSNVILVAIHSRITQIITQDGTVVQMRSINR